MTKFKKFLTLLTATFLCFGLFAFVSCGGDGSDGSSSPDDKAEAYVFIVRNADNTPATGVSVQLCTPSEASDYMCYMPVAVDGDGKVTYTPAGFPGAGVYEIHLLDANNAQLAFTGEKTTTATFGSYTLTLTAAN